MQNRPEPSSASTSVEPWPRLEMKPGIGQAAAGWSRQSKAGTGHVNRLRCGKTRTMNA